MSISQKSHRGFLLTFALALTMFYACANVENDLEKEKSGGSSSGGSSGGSSPGSNNGHARDCISFHNHFDNNRTSTKKFYADKAISPSNNLGTSFGDPQKAINGAKGTNGFSGSADVYSLRDHTGNNSGELILKWSNDIVCNGTGTDFVVFENAMFLSGGNGEAFIEPAVVYLSRDGVDWVAFPFDYLGKDTNSDGNPDDETASPGSGHYGHWKGFAGLYPVFYHEDNHNYVQHNADPFKTPDRTKNYGGDITGFGGGDHFDLDDLPNSQAGREIKENGFRYIKLIRATKVENPDHPGHKFPIVPNSFDQGGSDIDAVYARYLKPIP